MNKKWFVNVYWPLYTVVQLVKKKRKKLLLDTYSLKNTNSLKNKQMNIIEYETIQKTIYKRCYSRQLCMCCRD